MDFGDHLELKVVIFKPWALKKIDFTWNKGGYMHPMLGK